MIEKTIIVHFLHSFKADGECYPGTNECVLQGIGVLVVVGNGAARPVE